MSDVSALILAAPAAQDRVVVAVSLSERARRSARHSGVAPERIHVVRTPADLAAARDRIHGPVVVVRALDQVVMPALVRVLEPARAGVRVAVDDTGAYVGALRLDSVALPQLWGTLERDLAGGDRAVAAELLTARPDAGTLAGSSTRHPATTDAEARAATTWLWQFIHKPELDTFMTKYVCRPIARPLTHLFLRLPLTPNMITVLSIIVGQIACLLAAGPSKSAHIAGLALVVFGNSPLDAVDGEVARLRLQFSRAGDWLDSFGDHLLRITLILAIGHHVAAQRPDLPIWPITLAIAAVTFLAMLPMYWYCLSVHRTINLQHYGDVVGNSQGLVGQLSSRDFTDYAFFVLGVLGLSIVSLAGLAVGAAVALVTVLVAHPRAVRRRRAVRRPVPA